ncbi:MAG: archease [Candidatus Thermoplasmatota archaeon]|nr:archease [Candidatus Thermoplasmatota archaeon]
MSPWQVLDHTADVGLTVTAESLEAAMGELVEGYGHLVCPDGEIEQREERVLEVQAPNLEDLVIDLLDEVNVLHQMEGFIPARCTARLDLTGDAPRVSLTMHGEAWDEERHGYLMEIKATTYHGMEVIEEPARIVVIFDI